MSVARAVGWVAAFGVTALVYVVSVAVSGEWRPNGAWFLLVIVFAGFGLDNLRVVITGRGGDDD